MARSLVLRMALPLGLIGLPLRALAAVVISTAATENMSCQSGVCAPTGTAAILNAGDLETLLASGNVEVTTTGAGVEANDIAVKAGFSWSAATALTLTAHRTVSIGMPVSVQGLAAVTLTTGKKGALTFAKDGSIGFANTASALTINGIGYTLENAIKPLASAIAQNPSGAFALAADYDAGQDGTYTSVPIPTPFDGSFEGLGHRIANLTLDDRSDTQTGLFSEIDQQGAVRDLRMSDATITAEEGGEVGAVAGISYGALIDIESQHGVVYGAEGVVGGAAAGGLVGYTEYDSAAIVDSSASGSVTNEGPEGAAGGLVGTMDGGTVERSHAAVSVSSPFEAGGLVGGLGGLVDQSWSAGKVSAPGSQAVAGGIAGDASGTITNSYSTSTVLVGSSGEAGGLLASDDGTAIADSYSTGRVKRAADALRGGFVGYDSAPGDIGDAYWDLATSGIARKSQGAGSPKNDPGILGLTTEQLQSGLPSGFDPKIWGENAGINGGLPYLLANPPE